MTHLGLLSAPPLEFRTPIGSNGSLIGVHPEHVGYPPRRLTLRQLEYVRRKRDEIAAAIAGGKICPDASPQIYPE
jgi:hypothetical protein